MRPSRTVVWKSDGFRVGELGSSLFPRRDAYRFDVLPHFRAFHSAYIRMWVDAELADAALALDPLGAGGVERLLAAGGGPPGRGPTAVVRLPRRRERVHLRAVRHGGWLAGWLGDSLRGLERPVAELRAGACLAAAGAPVARPVLLVARRRGLLWSAVVGTLHEENASDGLRFLASRPGRERVLRAAEAAAQALRRFHDAGGLHADLHVGNLLIRERGDAVEVVVVDLDRARVRGQLGARERMAQLMRLYRSLVKRRLAEVAGRRGCARFVARYTDGDRALRRALLAHLPWERLRLWLHALGYRRG